MKKLFDFLQHEILRLSQTSCNDNEEFSHSLSEIDHLLSIMELIKKKNNNNHSQLQLEIKNSIFTTFFQEIIANSDNSENDSPFVKYSKKFWFELFYFENVNIYEKRKDIMDVAKKYLNVLRIGKYSWDFFSDFFEKIFENISNLFLTNKNELSKVNELLKADDAATLNLFSILQNFWMKFFINELYEFDETYLSSINIRMKIIDFSPDDVTLLSKMYKELYLDERKNNLSYSLLENMIYYYVEDNLQVKYLMMDTCLQNFTFSSPKSSNFNFTEEIQLIEILREVNKNSAGYSKMKENRIRIDSNRYIDQLRFRYFVQYFFVFFQQISRIVLKREIRSLDLVQDVRKLNSSLLIDTILSSKFNDSTLYYHFQILRNTIATLETTFLHVGIPTQKILRLYVVLTQILQTLDINGSILSEIHCRIKRYLRHRSDTVQCIVEILSSPSHSSLFFNKSEFINVDSTDIIESLDSENTLVSHKLKDHTLEAITECEKNAHDFLDKNYLEYVADEDFSLPWDYWSIPSICGQTGIIICNNKDLVNILISIYNNKNTFVNEYKKQFAARVLSKLTYDEIKKEFFALKQLKKKFGDTHMLNCSVMLDDLANSQRLLDNLWMNLPKEIISKNFKLEIFFALSGHFWPDLDKVAEDDCSAYLPTKHWHSYHIVFDENERPNHVKPINSEISTEKMNYTNLDKQMLPPEIYDILKEFSEEYERVVMRRTLLWNYNLSRVEMELVFDDGISRSFLVSPFHASIIHRFSIKTSWTITELCEDINLNKRNVKCGLDFWIAENVLNYHKDDDHYQLRRMRQTVTTIDEMEESQIEQQETSEKTETISSTTLPPINNFKENRNLLVMLWSYLRGVMRVNNRSMKLEEIEKHVIKGFPMNRFKHCVKVKEEDKMEEELKRCLLFHLKILLETKKEIKLENDKYFYSI
ncbi:hypothetical protein SNEBB_007120 [Seison nebaliae]|nr:hypothetical protein SNEBB_007120 [Seison nebaliae]